MAIQIFDEFLKEFEQPITAFVSNSVQNLAAAIDTPLRTAVTLWVVLYGIAILRGTIREPIMSFAWSAARVIVIVALATNASTFQTYVTGLFFESLPKEIGNAIAGAGLDTSSGAPFDKLLNKGIEVATKIYEQSGLTNIAPALDCRDPDGVHGGVGFPAVRRAALRQDRAGDRDRAWALVHRAHAVRGDASLSGLPGRARSRTSSSCTFSSSLWSASC